jgi:iron complex transport system permease protein
MLLVDDIARTIVATEIPLGIITSLLGAPLFGYLIKRGRLGWN